jgi:hypothetical protein
MKPRFIPAVFFLVVSCAVVEARPVGVWSYQLLVEQSDLVLIGDAESARVFDEKLQESPFSEILEGRLTTFKVESVLKGKAPGEKIDLVHFIVNTKRPVINGPLPGHFVDKDRRMTITSIDGVEVRQNRVEPRPAYLLFLKARQDGRYEPVTGQVDSTFSARKITPAD